jgi:hypothetical protein
MLKTSQINFRDPYVVTCNGLYYLYGTESATVWQGRPDGFSCFVSADLDLWDGPFKVFQSAGSFFADRHYWAPECHRVGDRYFLITTLGAADRKKGVYALAADSPAGPFALISECPLTPPDWACIDGTLYLDDDQTPYLVFSHTFEDVPTGDMAAVRLSDDLRRAVSEPWVLFRAVDAPWARPVPFARTEFGLEGDVYFTDGPCVHRLPCGKLMIIWSAWAVRGYAVGMAVADNGQITGPWRHLPEKLFPAGGGHGMLFRTFDGALKYVLHAPNETPLERPLFVDVIEEGDRLVLVGQPH